MGTRDGEQGTGSGTWTRRLTFKDLWRVKLVRIARFRDRDFGADLEEGRTGGHVADATRHDHQELRMERQTLNRMQRASVDRESKPSFGDREEQGRRKKGDVSSFHHSCSDRGGTEFACTHPLYLILELGNAVHMRQLLQHCAARQRCFLFSWTKSRRRKSLASERTHEMMVERRQTTVYFLCVEITSVQRDKGADVSHHKDKTSLSHQNRPFRCPIKNLMMITVVVHPEINRPMW